MLKKHRVRTRIRRNPNPYVPPSPVSQVLRLVDQRVTAATYKAKSIRDFRKSLRALVDDNDFWKQLERLRVSVGELKATLEELM